MEERHSCLSYPYWLVVHSGPEQEVRELIAYAEELQRIENDKSRIVVVSQCGIGIGSIALASLLGESSHGAEVANPMAPRPPHFPASAKNVIYLFMAGGPSQLELFDYKPRL